VVPESYLYGDSATYGHYQIVNSCKVVAEALTFFGAVWAGVFLARFGVCKKKA
jgi:hypothetical protein